MTSARTEFERLMRALEDWYADDTRALDFAGASGGSSGHGSGHRVLRKRPYPGPNWREEFQQAEDRNDPVAQEAINAALREELYGLDHGPSKAGPASGLFRGTKEWEWAVAAADGSLRAVARRFGTSHSEVRRLRLKHPSPERGNH